MEAIINKYMSLMIDEILEKALEEKPVQLPNQSLLYNNQQIYINKQGIVFYDFNRYFKNFTDSNGDSSLKLTDKQQKKINKIFEKWGNNANK